MTIFEAENMETLHKMTQFLKIHTHLKHQEEIQSMLLIIIFRL